jgi:hypothetical protein
LNIISNGLPNVPISFSPMVNNVQSAQKLSLEIWSSIRQNVSSATSATSLQHKKNVTSLCVKDQLQMSLLQRRTNAQSRIVRKCFTLVQKFVTFKGNIQKWMWTSTGQSLLTAQTLKREEQTLPNSGQLKR